MAKQETDIANRGIVLISVLLFLTSMVLAIAFSSWAERAITEQIKLRMLDTARSAATLLDGDELAGLTENDGDTPAYQKALGTLRAFQDSVELSYIYCMRQTGKESFEFTVDPTLEDPAAFGEPAVCTDALTTAAQGVPAVDLEPYDDRRGSFYSAYCPVFDSRGDVASIVGVDFAATWFEERVARINHILVASCVASLVMAVLAATGALRLVDAKKKHDKSLQRAISYDELTGLQKMSHFFESSEAIHDEIVRLGQEPAILFADLVGMKFFNQRHGFAEGNKLLKAFAALLSEHFGAERCARFGQDQFAVTTYAQDLEERLDAFVAACETMNDGNTLPVRIGIYGESLEEVNISTACDRAKAANVANGRTVKSAYAFFDEAMLEQMERREYVTENLDRAIAEGWIKVYYQPIVRAANGKVCDEEALARWIDTERGMLAPSEFIPALEDTKLVYKLDLNVLEQTLQKMRRLAQEGLYVVPASINLSRSDFEMCDMVEEVRKRVDEAGIDHAMINVEITETDMGRDFEYMKRQVERFHQLGFSVWMDDFGSEYSSLDYLQNLQFDLIKFDMRFMRQFDNSDKSKVILTELMKMAIALGIDTICEGVETAEQVEFLREVGCGMLQGYYYSKPLSLDEILMRYKDGAAIGFENPAEASYYVSLGRVNLYDLSTVTRDDEDGLLNYFDTIPMAIVETSEEDFMLVRCNQTYRQFIVQVYDVLPVGMSIPYELATQNNGTDFVDAMYACGRTSEHVWIDERMPNGMVIHALVRHLATNPVTHKIAIAIAVLSMS
ncbi:MAG: EAL domain-containing protein [Atopobiaceae bacterium]|nr:EAL domain-containing protein [Atopobiaceae bacterium]